MPAITICDRCHCDLNWREEVFQVFKDLAEMNRAVRRMAPVARKRGRTLHVKVLAKGFDRRVHVVLVTDAASVRRGPRVRA